MCLDLIINSKKNLIVSELIRVFLVKSRSFKSLSGLGLRKAFVLSCRQCYIWKDRETGLSEVTLQMIVSANVAVWSGGLLALLISLLSSLDLP